MVWPVAKLPAVDARNTAAPAISSGSPMRCSGSVACGLAIAHRILPQRAREIGPHQARRDAVGTHVLRSPFHRDVARQLHVGGLRDRIQAQTGGTTQAADGGDDDDGSATACGHLRAYHVGQPEIAAHVGAHDPFIGFVGAPAAGPRYGLTAALLTMMSMPPHSAMVSSTSACSSSLRAIWQGMAMASPPLSRMPAATVSHTSALRLRYHDLRAMLGHAFGDGAADALGRAGNDGDFAGQIEQRHRARPLLAGLPVSMLANRKRQSGPQCKRHEHPSISHADLMRLLHPASVAVIGASTRAGFVRRAGAAQSADTTAAGTTR